MVAFASTAWASTAPTGGTSHRELMMGVIGRHGGPLWVHGLRMFFDSSNIARVDDD